MDSSLQKVCTSFCCFFFFNDTATTEIYTLSLHDALPIYLAWPWSRPWSRPPHSPPRRRVRSEEHTSELQSRRDLVCRLLLVKKKNDRRAGAGLLEAARGKRHAVRESDA